MKLYYAPGACSLAPHIVLREAERHFDLERVDLKTHRTARGVDYRLINPKGYVPALELDAAGTEVLTEASVIMQFVADLVPHKKLAPPQGTFARYHLMEWLSFISTEIHKQFGPLFTKNLPESVAASQRAKIGERFTYVADVLADRAFLMGETFTIADAYLYVMTLWAGSHHVDLQLYPNLDDFEHRIANRPSVIAALDAEGLTSRHHYKRSA